MSKAPEIGFNPKGNWTQFCAVAPPGCTPLGTLTMPPDFIPGAVFKSGAHYFHVTSSTPEGWRPISASLVHTLQDVSRGNGTPVSVYMHDDEKAWLRRCGNHSVSHGVRMLARWARAIGVEPEVIAEEMRLGAVRSAVKTEHADAESALPSAEVLAKIPPAKRAFVPPMTDADTARQRAILAKYDGGMQQGEPTPMQTARHSENLGLTPKGSAPPVSAHDLWRQPPPPPMRPMPLTALTPSTYIPPVQMPKGANADPFSPDFGGIPDED